MSGHPSMSPTAHQRVSRLPNTLRRLRNTLLGSLKFQRMAASFPLTRAVSRRRARDVFDLCAGFVYSQILFSAVKLRLFDCFTAGPRRLDDVARELQLTDDAARRLLDGAVALQLLERVAGQRYAIGPRGAVVASNPGILQMIAHHEMLYRDLVDPVAMLRGKPETHLLSDFWAYATSTAPDAETAEKVAPYTALMAASQTLIADDVLAAYPLARHSRLLDVGGGDGTFLKAVAAKIPQIDVMLFDLPAVAAQAKAGFAAEGIAARAEVFGGDFFKDPLPLGADVISLVRIIHDHDDAPVEILLRRVRAALGPGGCLLIAEPMSDATAAETVGDAYFGFYLMAMGSGRPRTSREIIAMTKAAGFASAQTMATRMPLQTGLIVAKV